MKNIKSERILAYDLARMIAIFGMIIVNFNLVMSVVFMILSIIFAQIWLSKFKQGPLEELFRWLVNIDFFRVFVLKREEK